MFCNAERLKEVLPVQGVGSKRNLVLCQLSEMHRCLSHGYDKLNFNQFDLLVMFLIQSTVSFATVIFKLLYIQPDV